MVQEVHEIYERLPDGNTRLVSRTFRTLSDKEVKGKQRRARLVELNLKPSLSQSDIQQGMRLLVEERLDG